MNTTTPTPTPGAPADLASDSFHDIGPLVSYLAMAVALMHMAFA